MKTDTWSKLFTDFLVAMSLLTRFPLPRLPDDVFQNGARAAWAYPLTGLAVGAVAAALGWATTLMGLPATVITGLVIGTLMIATGAMHEDGLADVADGFWGGSTPERRLEIMKDSQIGTYGTLALILSVGLRWSAYVWIVSFDVLIVIAVAVLSRCAMPALMHAMRHARATGLSRSVGQPGFTASLMSLAIGSGLGAVLMGMIAMPILVVVCLATVLVGWIAKRKIGGQTGDVLGASQQIAEIAALMAFLVLI